MRMFVFCSFYFLIVNARKRSFVCIHSNQSKGRREIIFSSKINLWSYPQSLIQRAFASITRERISQAFTMSIDYYHLFSCCHKQEPCQLVKRFLLADIMPWWKHGNMTRDWTYSHIRISWYETFHRYIAIDRYINIRAKTGNTTIPLTSFKGHQWQPSAMIFGKCPHI